MTITFYVEFFPNQLSPPSLNRFSLNFAALSAIEIMLSEFLKVTFTRKASCFPIHNAKMFKNYKKRIRH